MKLLQIIPIPEQTAFYTKAAAKYLGISPNTIRKRADLLLISCRMDENGYRVFLLEDLDHYRKSLPPFRAGDNSVPGRLTKTGRQPKGGAK